MEQKPSEVARWLRVSPSTIRAWSSEYSAYLSNSAAGGAGRHRVYNALDVRILSFVQQMRRTGAMTEEIEEALAKLQQENWEQLPPAPDPPLDIETGPAIPENIVRTELAARAQTLMKDIVLREAQIVDLQKRLDERQQENKIMQEQLTTTREELGVLKGKLSSVETERASWQDRADKQEQERVRERTTRLDHILALQQEREHERAMVREERQRERRLYVYALVGVAVVAAVLLAIVLILALRAGVV